MNLRLKRVLSHDRVIVLACLAAAAGLSWLWLARAPMGGMGDVWTAAYLAPAFAMWALMMVAMMLPSAAPMILLHARFGRAQATGRALAGTAVFALAYLAVWSLFSIAATLLQAALVWAGAISAMALAIGDARLAGVLLILAGLYQLTPLKRACLAECRSPISFLMRLWRPGVRGAARLGLAHGAYCLGCCWALMALLFVGGAMSLGWVAVLAGLVFVERLAPPAWRLSEGLAVVLIVAGAMLLVGVDVRG